MIEKVYYWSFFLLAFLLPFQGLPKVNLFGMGIRVGIVAIVPVILLSVFNFRMIFERLGSLKNPTYYFLISFFFLAIIVTLSNQIDSRSVGFIIWLGVSLAVFFIGGALGERSLIHGALTGQACNLIYIILQFFFHDSIWVPDSFYHLNFLGKLRAFGLMGEPSYLAILLVPCLIYSNRLSNQFFRIVLNSLFVFGLLFSYSRVALLALAILLLLELILTPKKVLKGILPFFLIIGMGSVLYNPKFYGFKELSSISKKTFERKRVVSKVLRGYDKNTHPLAAGSTQQRLLSLKRGGHFLLNFPFGVGLGNSHRELRKYYSERLEKKKFSQRTRWKKNVSGLHNHFLEIAVETGILGLILFVGFLLSISFELYLLSLRKEFLMLSGTMFCMQFAQNINMPAMWIILGFCLNRIIEVRKIES